jgi:hypothetical protein
MADVVIPSSSSSNTVTYGGLGGGQPVDNNAAFESPCLSTPNFDGSIRVVNEGPIVQPTFENKSPSVYLYPGAVIFPPS